MNKHTPPQTVAGVIDKIGGTGKVALALKVPPPSVSRAKAEGVMPASWSVAVRRLAADSGVDCPLNLFRLRGLE